MAASLTACTNSPNDTDTLSFGELFEDEGVTEETTWRAIDQLWNQPTFEERMTEHQTMLDEMKTQINSVVPGAEWKDISDGSYTGGCAGDYLFTNGQSKLIHLVSGSPLDEATFAQLSSLVLPIAANHGFTERADTGTDTESLRLLQVRGPQGSDFTLNSVNKSDDQGFSLVVESGCYMEEATKENLRTVGIPFAAENNRWPWAIPDEPRYQ